MKVPEPRGRDSGRLAENIVYFARALRRAGLPVGPASVVDAIRAVEVAGITTRDDFYWTLHALFVKKREQQPVFDEAFRLFWRSRKYLEKMLSMFLPVIERAAGGSAAAGGRGPRRRGAVRPTSRARRRS